MAIIKMHDHAATSASLLEGEEDVLGATEMLLVRGK